MLTVFIHLAPGRMNANIPIVRMTHISAVYEELGCDVVTHNANIFMFTAWKQSCFPLIHVVSEFTINLKMYIYNIKLP